MATESTDSMCLVWLDTLETSENRLRGIYNCIWDNYLFSQPDSAYYMVDKMYEFATQNNSTRFIAEALRIKGTAADLLGNFNEALTCFEQGMDIYKTLNSTVGVSAFLSDIGTLYSDRGDFRTALSYYLQSLEIKQNTDDRAGMAALLNNIGNVYYDLAEFSKAVEYFTAGLSISKELGQKKTVSAILNNIGNIYSVQGNETRAIEFYKQSWKIKIELNDKIGIGNSLINIGMAYTDLGNYTDALSYSQRSLDMYELLGNQRGMAFSLSNIGTIYKKQAQYDKALVAYSESLRIREDLEDKHEILNTLNLIGSVYQLTGKSEEAIGLHRQALAMSNQIGFPYGVKTSSRALTEAFFRTSEPDSVMVYITILKNTVETELEANYYGISEHEKQIYFVAMESDFGMYYDFAISYNELYPQFADSAYNLILNTKGLALKSTAALRSSILSSGDSALISEYEKWILLKQKLSVAYSQGIQASEIEDEINELEKLLIKKSKVFGDFEGTSHLDWKQVRAALKPGEAAIEFVCFKRESEPLKPTAYGALVTKPDSKHPEALFICYENQLTKTLGAFQGNNQAYINRIYGTNSDPQTGLYATLWKPLESSLKNVHTIYYSPTGLLHKISFASITNDAHTSLSEHYSFRQLSTTGRLVLPQHSSLSGKESFFLTGGVNFNSDSSERQVWNYLPGSLEETEHIYDLLQKNGREVKRLVSVNATELNFKSEILNSNVVHVATHGFFFPDPDDIEMELIPDSGAENQQELEFRAATNYANWSFVNNKNPLMRSGIVLANANDVWSRDPLAEGEDGILTAQEVSTLDLRNTKLVVLSACETGLGDIKGSEGVYGLQRAFKMAGVKYLIMSLWQVPDKETSEFMILFYKNLIKLKDIPTAFNKTQKVMREKYDPYYWGAFVLIE